MKIALLGDIALFGDFSVKYNPDLFDRLKVLSDYLSGFDYVIGNLETPFSKKKKRGGAKSAYIYSDPENIEILKFLHVTAVSLANNHMYDFGQEGVDTTIELLEKHNIRWFGTDGKDYRIDDGGNRIAVNGFCCYSSNPLKLSSRFGKKGLNAIRHPEIEELMVRNHEEGWLNIVSVHSGLEHVSTPSIDQVRLSRKLAHRVPYIWHGHHPHVVQGVDYYNGSVIAHSLGNFIFSEHKGDRLCPKLELSQENRIGMILEIDIENNVISNRKTTFTKNEGSDGVRLLNDDRLNEKYDVLLSRVFENPEKYEADRRTQRAVYINQRKEMRDFKWFMKRMRPRYFRLLVDYRRNSKKYNKAIRNHLRQ